jgi:thioesterase domain-containing protein
MWRDPLVANIVASDPPYAPENAMIDRLHRLQSTLHSEIPLSAALGLRVVSYVDSCVTLEAPLAPNINHKDSAFAGSLNAVATLTGWSLLWLLLDEAALPGKIVIQDSAIEYRAPVVADFAVRCRLPEAAQLQRFLLTLRKRQRARLALTAQIVQGDAVAVYFSGRYVVQLGSA